MTRNDLATYFSVDPRVISGLLKDYGLVAKKYQHSEETKQKRLASLKKAWESKPGLRQKMSQALKDNNSKRAGKTYEDIYGEKASEIKSKLVESHTGLMQSDYTKEKRRKSLVGRKMRDSSKQLLSASRKRGFQEGNIKLSHRTGCGRGGFKEDLGHYVRSTYEYNFAKMLLDNGVEYQYEPIRYNIVVDGEVTGYTPDFKIADTYYEIKNGYNVNDQVFCKKLAAVKEQHNIQVVVLIGPCFSVNDLL